MKKKYTVITLIVLTVLILAYVLTLVLTSKQKDVADQFFEYIRGSRYTYAYDMTSPKFQRNTDLSAFVDYSNRLKLKKQTGFKSYWRVPGSRKVKLYGKLIYDGYDLPTSLILVKIGNEWKLTTLKIEATTQTYVPEMPEDKEVNALLQNSLSNLLSGVKTGDYSKLYNMFGKKIKENISLVELSTDFENLAELLADIELETGDEMKVTLQKILDPSGILHLKGIYADIMKFEFKYVMEDDNWMLVGVSTEEVSEG